MIAMIHIPNPGWHDSVRRKALETKEPRAATIKVTSAGAKTWRPERRWFFPLGFFADLLADLSIENQFFSWFKMVQLVRIDLTIFDPSF